MTVALAGARVDVASLPGGDVEHAVAGDGPTTVVLVNGSGGPMDAWRAVWSPLAAVGKVFAYNRAGIGRSAAPTSPQHGDALVTQLRDTLQAAGLAPPWVLVGHSFGGLVVQLLARRSPADIAGVLLLEATAPDDVAVMAAHENGLQRTLRRVLDTVAPTSPFAEVRHAAATADTVRAAPPFPPVPLTVLTGGRPAMAWATPKAALAARAAHQHALAQLSPRGRQVIAARSGHFPQFSEPALVVDEVLTLTRRA